MKKNINLLEQGDIPWLTVWILLIIIAFTFDNQIMNVVKALQFDFLKIIFTAITYTMTLSWGLAVIILFIGFFTEHKTFFGSMISLAAVLGICFLLKSVVPRARPNFASQSFPSGHSARAFAIAGYLEKVYDKKYFYALAVLVALSRVYLLEHFPSDAVVGAFIGIIISEIVFRLNLGEKIERFLKF